jgi:hypothetical protein
MANVSRAELTFYNRDGNKIKELHDRITSNRNPFEHTRVYGTLELSDIDITETGSEYYFFWMYECAWGMMWQDLDVYLKHGFKITGETVNDTYTERQEYDNGKLNYVDLENDDEVDEGLNRIRKLSGLE